MSDEPEPAIVKVSGHSISCVTCGGHGLVLAMSGEPDECRDCGGSGRNWQYPGGGIARFHGGPLIGRITRAGANNDPSK